MKHIQKKRILLLADPTISDQEFSNLARWLTLTGIEECLRAAREIRRHLNASLLSGQDTPRLPDPQLDEVRKVLNDLERLLLAEANLSVKEALEQLANVLGYNRSLGERISFDRGTRFLIKKFGGSSVLAAPHEIRNESVHSVLHRDWPLQDNEDVRPK
jgi:hypothetical protein